MAKGDFGFNATISTRGMGTRKVRAMALDFGLGIIATSDNEARTRRSFYPIVTTGSSFTMTLGFVSWSERETFIQWYARFMRRVANGTAPSGVLTVRVPSHDFVRVCVPEGGNDAGIEFGEGVKDVAYQVSLPFIGASNPVDQNLGAKQAGISYFKGPGKSQVSRYFYPAGEQVKGAEQLDGTAFDPKTSGTEFPVFNPAEQLDPNIPEGIDF